MLLVYAVEMQTIEVNGASIAYLEGGSPSDPLALCLHGFPDTAYTWRHLMPVLVSHGWHVVCPNLRGFAPTKAPHNDAAGSAILGADANALHKAFGGDERAVLIGHDWGAAAAYKASFEEPDCWSKVITSAWPPSPSNIDFFSFEQMKRSWYVFLFQLEGAAELLSADNFSMVDRLWKDWAADGYDRAEDVERAKNALRDSACLRGALDHYRTLFVEQSAFSLNPEVPTLYIHGEQDGCIGVEIIKNFSISTLSAFGSRAVFIPEAGHFPHLEQPDSFNNEVLKALSEISGGE